MGWGALSVRRKVHKLILFYKIVYGLAPPYLLDLLKPCFPPQASYPLRNQDGLTFSIPQARTSSYIKSYIPSTIKLWNNLPLHIRNLPTLSSFSQSIKKLFYRTPKKLFNYGNRKANIIHCQLRNNVSSLNADLHKDYLRDNSVKIVVIKPKMFIIFSMNAHVMMMKDVLFLNVYQIWVCISQ